MRQALETLKTNRDSRYYFLALIISAMGDTFNDLAVLTSVYFSTKSIFGVAYFYIALYLGMFLFSPFAGFRNIKSNPSLHLSLLISVSFTVVGTVPFLVRVPFLLETLQVGLEGLGLFNSFRAVGTFLGAYLLIRVKSIIPVK